MHKRGQLFADLIMTYGWVLVVGLAGFAALVLTGVFTPEDVIPDRCVFSTQITCEDFLIGEDGVSVTVRNSGSRAVDINQVTFLSTALSGTCESNIARHTLEPGDKVTIIANEPSDCNYVGSDIKNRYTVIIDFSWRRSNLAHFIEGEILAKKISGSFVGSLDGVGKS